MRFIFTRHAQEKFAALELFGWKITERKVTLTILKPKWTGVSRYGQETAMTLLDTKHILRVIFDRDGDIMKIITFHPARRGSYESTLR